MAEETYVSGEQYHEMKSKRSNQKQVTMPVSKLASAVIVVVLCAISFGVGVAYQKHATKTVLAVSASGGNSALGSNGFASRPRGGGIGQVNAISASSIVITSLRDGTSKTYAIDSSTTVTNNGQTSDVSSIAVGDTVIVRPSATNDTIAATIMVNPSFGSGSGAPNASLQTQ